MTGYGTPITTAAHFPNARVFKREGPNGRVYTIVFENLERKSGFEVAMMLASLCALELALLAFLPAAGIIAFLLGLPALALRAETNGPPRRTIRRAIEIRPDSDQLRIFRSGRLRATHSLSGLAYLTVEDHPDAQWERVNRQQRSRKGPGTLEYVHCLFGWFGVGGANKIELLERVEWPARHSLREIREAIEWTRKRIAAGPEQSARAARGNEEKRSRRSQGAPLD